MNIFIGSALQQSDYEETQFDPKICLIGVLLLAADYVIYGCTFLYVLNRARKKVKLQKLEKLAMVVISFPNFYFFTGWLLRLVAFLSCSRNESCWMYD